MKCDAASVFGKCAEAPIASTIDNVVDGRGVVLVLVIIR